MVQHLGNLHGEVQALCRLPADVADAADVAAAAADAAAGARTPAQAAGVGDIQKRLQAGAFAAAHGGAKRPHPAVAPLDRGQEAVQWLAEQTGQ